MWHVGGGINEGFHGRFEVEATRAGIALGSTLNGEPGDIWLHCVFSDLVAHNSKLLFAPSEDGGVIVQVCEASAVYCVRLEKQALIERKKTFSAHATPVQGVTEPLTNHQAVTPIPNESGPTEQTLREAVIRKVENSQAYTVLSIPEAALYFEVKPRTIHRWKDEDELRSGARRGSITIKSILRWQRKRSRKRSSP